MKVWIEQYLQQYPERVKDFWRLMRFGVTGVISSLIHYAVYCVVIRWMGAATSYTIGYLVGLICNYVLTTFFTFQRHPSLCNALGFVSSHIINYILEIALLELFLWCGASELLAPVWVMIIVVPVNFLLLRYVFVNTKKHILFVHDKGQMCNNIIQYGHVYAWAREHHVCAISLRFSYKYQYFQICHTFWHNFLTHLLVKSLAKMHIIPTVDFDLLESQAAKEEALTQHPVMAVTGWRIRFYDLFAKYRSDIVRLFTFDAPVEKHVEHLLAKWRQDEDNVLLGVHIRRGDYNRLLNGRYYFDDATFANAIQQFKDQMSHKHLVVIVCGNVKMPKRFLRMQLPAVDFVFPEGNPAEDLCALSHCDYLIGPPSSYSLVASMYHDVPLHFIFKAYEPFTADDFHSFDYHLHHFDDYFIPSLQ